MSYLFTEIRAAAVKKKPEKPSGYWKEQLTGTPNRIELSTDCPRPASKNSKLSFLPFSLSQELIDDLNQLGYHYEVSLPAVLLTAFKTLLYRHTNQTDLVVGYPTIEYNAVNGTIVRNLGKLLPIRTNLIESASFIDAMQQVQQSIHAAIDHKGEAIDFFAGSSPAIETAYSFFKQVIFAFKNNDGAATLHRDTPQNRLTYYNQAKGTEIKLTIENSATGIEAVIEYNEQLFEHVTIQRFAAHYQVLLSDIVYNPKQDISHLRILESAELNKLLYEWNRTETPLPYKCIHELFEEQVKLNPKAIAVQLYHGTKNSFNKKPACLTYTELNSKSNQVASYLKTLGVGPDVMVGIYMKRCPEMIIGLLGILKAGGAYVPLDAMLPQERLDFMLKDSGISIVLTRKELKHNLPTQLKAVCLDNDWKIIAGFSNTNITTPCSPQHLAYVIYTSGSTGLPKGTLITHYGAVNYLTWCIEAYHVKEGIGSPVNSSLGFDATITSLFSPLLSGKQLLLLPEDGEIEALAEVLNSKNRFSLIKITPAHLEILNQLLEANEFRGQTNSLVIGGEALTRKTLSPWQNLAPNTQLINEYGPTETVVGCCIYNAKGKELKLDEVPIGRPIANTQLYILDKHLQPVPTGSVGEIYIGGAGVARGYLNQPELTAQKFIRNPFGNNPELRLYKTGDLARYLNDGNIVYIGRSDFQVKIRGYRIELGEIESAIANIAGVRQNVVIAREYKPGNKQLVAYLVMHNSSSLTPREIKERLCGKLPKYMLPSDLIILETLPLTANGKIDRNALPDPEQHKQRLETESTAPGNELESELLTIFSKCLNNQRITVKDNYFDLGGDSMQAYRIFAQIKKTTGTQLSISVLFQAPTIEKLAIYLQGKEAIKPWSSLVPIQPQGSKSPLFCIHAGAGTVLFYRDLARHLGNDQPVYGLQPVGVDGKRKFHNSIEEMAAHYVQEIRKVNPDGPYHLGGYCFGAVVAFEMAQQLTAGGYQVATLAIFNGISPTYVQFPAINPAEVNDTDRSAHIEVPEESLPVFSWELVRRMQTKERFIYLAKKARARSENLYTHVVRKNLYRALFSPVMLLMHFVKYYQRMGGVKSHKLIRKFYLFFMNPAIVKAYRPTPYNGTVIIFRSPQFFPDPHLGWSNFVTGNIKVFDIPGHHADRRGIMNEPFVQDTAKALEKYMAIKN